MGGALEQRSSSEGGWSSGEIEMKKGRARRSGNQFRADDPIRSIVIAITLMLAVPIWARADDYPNGTNSYGVVSNIATFSGWTRFVVSGTRGNGQSGADAFWIDASTTAGASNLANVLAAASQQKFIRIWHYGVVFNYGGQTGYMTAIIFVDY